MAYYGPIRLKSDNQNIKGEDIKISRRLLGKLRRDMGRFSLKAGRYTYTTVDGTFIEVKINYNGPNPRFIAIINRPEQVPITLEFIFMDSGAIAFPFPTQYGDADYPLVVYEGSEVLNHIATGYEDLILLPSTDEATFIGAGNTTVFSWAIFSATPNIGQDLATAPPADSYWSPVFIDQNISANVGTTTEPPWRYSGWLRLAAQAKNGVGLLIDDLHSSGYINPDKDGLIFSTDYRFFHVRIQSPNITYTELVPINGDYLISHLIANETTITDDEKTKILAHILSQLRSTANVYTETVTNLASVYSNGKVPFAYEWHWSYQLADHECSIVTYRHADPNGWAGTLKYHLTTLSSISFSVPTESGFPTATCTIEESDVPFQPSDTEYFWVLAGNQLCAFLAPYGVTQTVQGTNAPFYVFYSPSTGRGVARYNKPSTTAVSSVSNPLNYVCGDSSTSQETSVSSYSYNSGSFSIFGETCSSFLPLSNINRVYEEVIQSSIGLSSNYSTMSRVQYNNYVTQIAAGCGQQNYITTGGSFNVRTYFTEMNASWQIIQSYDNSFDTGCAAIMAIDNPDALYFLSRQEYTKNITSNRVYGPYLGYNGFYEMQPFNSLMVPYADPTICRVVKSGTYGGLTSGNHTNIISTVTNNIGSSTEDNIVLTGVAIGVTGSNTISSADLIPGNLRNYTIALKSDPCDSAIFRLEESWSGAMKYNRDINLYDITGGYDHMPSDYIETSSSYYMRPHFVGWA